MHNKGFYNPVTGTLLCEKCGPTLEPVTLKNTGPLKCDKCKAPLYIIDVINESITK